METLESPPGFPPFGLLAKGRGDDRFNQENKRRSLILKIVEESKLDKGGVEKLARDRFGKSVKALRPAYPAMRILSFRDADSRAAVRPPSCTEAPMAGLANPVQIAILRRKWFAPVAQMDRATAS